ncbi:hypothetical protein [uncultured Celeribacter sp.]|uniref:hypothetical protein n=1 Tax=uncultured Celeribacter sp. TaxID=1303376 RepID=UPI002AA7F23A|nr:hypothetical protein [uncultured Celeribacter sp.]
MDRSKLPPLQGRRFDVETLQYNALKLARQADKGPTFLRHHGRVAYVVMTEEIFDQLWPDPRRAWSIDEMPPRILQLLEQSLQEVLSSTGEDSDT